MLASKSMLNFANKIYFLVLKKICSGPLPIFKIGVWSLLLNCMNSLWICNINIIKYMIYHGLPFYFDGSISLLCRKLLVWSNCLFLLDGSDLVTFKSIILMINLTEFHSFRSYVLILSYCDLSYVTHIFFNTSSQKCI